MDKEKTKLWHKWNQHKRGTKGRTDKNGNEVEFLLSFDEWLQIWLESGHLNERGCRKGQFVMARKNDIGHYEVGNVEIKLSSENNKEKTFTDEYRAKLSAAKKGRKQTEETRAKISASMKRRKRQKLTCPHCGTTCAVNTFYRYHGDNCKTK